MKHISILIPKGQYSIVNIAGSFQILNYASDMYREQTGKPLFEIEFVGHSNPAHDSDGIYTITPSRTIEEVDKTNVILIPAVHGDLAESVKMNQPLIAWIKQQHEQGAEVASFCIGVFLLAASGILKGKYCSTHWAHARDLEEMFPDIKVKPENIVTESDGVFTSGGAYAFTNLIIYLIEKYGGRELAIQTAKAFMIDIDKHNQTIFMIFNGQKDHKDEMVLKVQEKIEKNYDQLLNVSELAGEQATNRRTLERRFKAATGNSVFEYIQRVRVESAKKILENTHKQVVDAMYAVGYNDVKAFREVFKKYTGIVPKDYKKKFTMLNGNTV